MTAFPGVAPPRVASLPRVSSRTLDNGLTVLAVRRPGVPLVELRLRLPFAGSGAAHAAKADLLAQTLLAGTQRHSGAQLAATLQSLGGPLQTDVDADRLAIAGSCLSGRVVELLRLLAEVLTESTYPADDVTGERDRLVQEIAIARSQPAVLAGVALMRRLYGDHPYGVELPEPEEVAGVTPAGLRRLHRSRVTAGGAVLVLVGDLQPARALDAVEEALGGWGGGTASGRMPAVPTEWAGPTVLVDRPGAAQTNIRMAAPALSRSAPGYAALVLANAVFGGYFSSRLVANIREKRGYTYSPHSGLEHPVAGSRLTVSADVATAVTAPALMEIGYELARIATLPVEQGELDDARRYTTGTLALATATQAGLATMLTRLTAEGLGIEHLRDFPRALAALTPDHVQAAARDYLAPTRFATVLLGDTARVGRDVAAITPVASASPGEVDSPATAAGDAGPA